MGVYGVRHFLAPGASKVAVLGCCSLASHYLFEG